MNKFFNDNNFLLLRGFLGYNEAKRLATAFKTDSLAAGMSDTQVPNCPSVYNYLPFVRLLVNKLPHCELASGLKLLPTYTYARYYNQNGAELKRHRDRESCEISLTLNLDKTVDWPIYFESKNGKTICIELDPGDAVMYMGCVAEHWREAYSGNDHTQVFLHYVDAEGPYSDYFFDLKARDERKST